MYSTIIIKENISETIRLLKIYKPQLILSGNLFAIVQNEVNENGDISADFLDVIKAADDLEYTYINTIIVPAEHVTESELPDNVIYIVWLAQSQKHFFNKDAIREKHIWKDVEWGKRSKNYNSKGKDPGNVWIPTIDDGNARIIEHILLDFESIINRIDKCSRQQGLNTLLITNIPIDETKLTNEIEIKIYIPDKSKIRIIKDYLPTKQSKCVALSGRVVWGTSENMSMIADNCVNVVVTSPPYWDLKDYFKEGQIGQESYQQYLDRLGKVWSECYKKLTSEGSLWININIRVKKGKVILIPRDLILQCKSIGYHYKGVLIWHKSSGIPTHDGNIVDHHEYVLVFSKDSKLRINRCILDYSDYRNEKINAGLIWNINRKAGSVGKQFIHPAIYPNDLVTRIVEITTETGQMVLDPFLGSGTTLISAVLAKRNCIGFEYNNGFKDLIEGRIRNEVKIPFKLDI